MMGKPAINLLMTCVGGDLASEYLKAYKESRCYDVCVTGVDGRSDAVGQYFCDYFYTVPMGGAQDYIDRMIDIVIERHIQLIIPGSDGEALALSLHRQVFADQGCQIAAPDFKILQTLNDKAQTYQKLSDANLPCADWYSVNSHDELQKATKDIYDRYAEFVIKPALSRGGRDVFVIRSDIEDEQHYFGGREIHLPYQIFLDKYVKSMGQHFPVVVMERLYEPVYDLDVLSWNGQAIQVVPRLRHNPAGIPFTGNTVKADQGLIDMGVRVAEILNLSWLLDVDVMAKKDGTPVVLEVNPRMSGSCPSSVHAGIPLFDQVIALSRGEKPNTVQIERDTVLVKYNAIQKVA